MSNSQNLRSDKNRWGAVAAIVALLTLLFGNSLVTQLTSCTLNEIVTRHCPFLQPKKTSSDVMVYPLTRTPDFPNGIQHIGNTYRFFSTGSDLELPAEATSLWMINEVGNFGGEIRLTEGTGTGNIGLKIWSTLDDGRWGAQCYVEQSGGIPYLQCGGGFQNGGGSFSKMLPTKLGQWHEVRLEIDVNNQRIRYWIDGQIHHEHALPPQMQNGITFQPLMSLHNPGYGALNGEIRSVELESRQTGGAD